MQISVITASGERFLNIEGLVQILEAGSLGDTERKFQTRPNTLSEDLLVGVVIGIGTSLTAAVVYDVCKIVVAWLRGSRGAVTITIHIEEKGGCRSYTFASDNLPSAESTKAIANELTIESIQ